MNAPKYAPKYKPGQCVVATWKDGFTVCGRIRDVAMQNGYNFYEQGFQVSKLDVFRKGTPVEYRHDAGWRLDSASYEVTVCKDEEEMKSVFLGACI